MEQWVQFKDMHKVKVRNRHSSESPRCFAIAHRHYVTKAKFTNLFVMGCPKAVSQPYVEKVCVCVCTQSPRTGIATTVGVTPPSAASLPTSFHPRQFAPKFKRFDANVSAAPNSVLCTHHHGAPSPSHLIPHRRCA